MSQFREKPFDQRKAEVDRLLKKYPNKIPVVIEKDKSCTFENTEMSVNKFLVPDELTVGQLIYTLRTRIKLQPEQAIFIFFNRQMVSSTDTMRQVYLKHKDKDDMLYGVYSSETTFG